MRRVLVLAALLCLAGLAWGQDNPLAGHEIGAVLPDTVFAFTDKLVGVTYSGPVVVEIDGRAALKISLQPASTPMPRRRWGAGDWLAAGLVGIAAAGLGYAIGQGVR